MAIEINSYRDVEFAISLINLIKEKCGYYDYVSKVEELKRNIRKFYKSFDESDTLVMCQESDGYVEKIEIPEKFTKDKESMKKWFNEYIRIEPYYSAYDCTGRPFTGWYRFAKLHGQWYCYHKVDYDV